LNYLMWRVFFPADLGGFLLQNEKWTSD